METLIVMALVLAIASNQKKKTRDVPAANPRIQPAQPVSSHETRPPEKGFLDTTGGQLLAAAVARRLSPPGSGVARASDALAITHAAGEALSAAPGVVRGIRDLIGEFRPRTQPIVAPDLWTAPIMLDDSVVTSADIPASEFIEPQPYGDFFDPVVEAPL